MKQYFFFRLKEEKTVGKNEKRGYLMYNKVGGKRCV
jgi:hypothetical protein